MRYPRAAIFAIVTVLCLPLSVAANEPPSLPSASVQDLAPTPEDLLVSGEPPQVTAESWILYDDTFDQVLASQEADLRREVASTTKMMTALVVLDEAGLDELVEISVRADAVGESEIGLIAGEDPWTVSDLLTSMLMRSANDAAIALAEHVGGTIGGFADLMNLKAAELGLENTQFKNPHGLDELGHYSSARDLLTIAQAGLDNATFAQIVQTETANMPDTADGEPRVATATNQLLTDYPGTIGVKTGYTDLAGQTLVAAAERDGRRMYAVVLGSEDHFADVVALIDYGFDEFSIVTLVARGDEYAVRRIAGLVDEAIAAESFDLFIGAAEAVEIEIVPSYTEEEPVLVAELDGEVIGQVALETSERPALPDLDDAFGWIERYWKWMWGSQ